MKMISLQGIFVIALHLSISQIVECQDIDYLDYGSDLDIAVIQNAEDASDFESSIKSSIYSDVYDYSNGDPVSDQAAMKPVDTAVITIYSIITVVGLIANAVVLFVIFAGNETGKTVTAIYILQLTVADTIFLFSLPVFSMQKVLDKWTIGSGICSLCQTIKFMNYYAGIFFLMAMSVDRYIAVAYSTRLTQIRTKKRTYITCFCMWIAALLMTLPVMLYAKADEHFGVIFCKVLFPGHFQPSDEENFIDIIVDASGASGSGDSNLTELNFEYDSMYDDSMISTPFYCDHAAQSNVYESWLIVDFVVAFLIPFLVIVASYVKILTHLKTSETKIGHTATNKAAKTRKRVTRMVAALVICFTVCWLPHHLFMLAKIKGFRSSVPVCHAIEEFFIALAFSNSAINPILYTFMGNNFRERFRKSVKNTQVSMRRHSSRSNSSKRRSVNSHSDPGQKKTLGLIVHYRRESVKNQGCQNGRPQNQISLLGSRRNRPSCDENNYEDRRTDYCGNTSIGEQTIETKIL